MSRSALGVGAFVAVLVTSVAWLATGRSAHRAPSTGAEPAAHAAVAHQPIEELATSAPGSHARDGARVAEEPHRAAVVPEPAPGLPGAAAEVSEPNLVIEGIVLDPDGRATSHARIDYLERETGRLRRNRARSDTNGHFRLEDISAARIDVRARHRDLAPSPWQSANLAAHDVAATVRLKLRTPGHVRGEVRGLDGYPVADHEVQLRCEDQPDEVRATTDSSGKFRFDSLPPGSASISAVFEDAGGEIVAIAKESVEIVAGETAFVVLSGVQPTALLVKGTVAAGGLAVADCRVEAYIEGFWVAPTRTSSDGTFELRLQRGGRVQFVLTPERDLQWGFDRELPAAGVGTVVLELPAGGLRGAVVPYDAECDTLAVSVRLASGRTAADSIATRTVEIESDGTWECRFLPPGVYDVTLIGTSEEWSASPCDAASIGVGSVAVADDVIEGLELTAGAAGAIRGTFSARGDAVGPWIRLFDESGRLVREHRWGGGEYTIGGLGPGNYWLVAGDLWSKVTEHAVLLPVRAHEATEHDITIGTGTVVSIERLEAKWPEWPLGVEVTVTDTDGFVYPVAPVMSMESGRMHSVHYDDENVAQFRAGPLPSGSYLVEVTAPEHAPIQRRIDVVGTEPVLVLVP